MGNYVLYSCFSMCMWWLLLLVMYGLLVFQVQLVRMELIMLCILGCCCGWQMIFWKLFLYQFLMKCWKVFMLVCSGIENLVFQFMVWLVQWCLRYLLVSCVDLKVMVMLEENIGLRNLLVLFSNVQLGFYSELMLVEQLVMWCIGSIVYLVLVSSLVRLGFLLMMVCSFCRLLFLQCLKNDGLVIMFSEQQLLENGIV